MRPRTIGSRPSRSSTTAASSPRPRASLPRLRPTLRGWTCIVVGLLILMVASQPGLSLLALPACLAIAAPVAAAAASLLRTRSSRTSRTISPDVAVVGEPVSITVRVGAGIGAGRWWDLRSADLAGAADGELVRDEDGMPTARSRVTALRRGRHETGPISVEVVDAFALVRSSRTLSGTGDLVALPAIVAVPAPPTSADGGVAASADARRGVARGIEDQIPREWRSGDGIRRVHWRATAHRGDLMVRQEEPHEDVGVAILLDAVADGYLEVAELDRAVELVASVAAAATDADARTALAIIGDDEATMLIGGAGATSTLEDVLVRLALLEPGDDAGRRPSLPAAPVLVAVLGRISESRAHEIAATRRSGAKGIAIVQGRPSAAALDALDHAGWVVQPWSSTTSVADVWALAIGGAR
jgi:uncharacterized protein (DUF58 family)